MERREETRCRHFIGSYEVERPLMVRWVIGQIPHGGPIELFLVPACSQRLDY